MNGARAARRSVARNDIHNYESVIILSLNNFRCLLSTVSAMCTCVDLLEIISESYLQTSVSGSGAP